MTGQDGAVCYTENNSPTYTPIDCVAYGNLHGQPLPSAWGRPRSLPRSSPRSSEVSLGAARRRSTRPTTPTTARPTSHSSTNPPRNNAATPTETLCPPGNPASPINPAGNVRKRKCKKKQKRSAEVAKKKKCKKKKKH